MTAPLSRCPVIAAVSIATSLLPHLHDADILLPLPTHPPPLATSLATFAFYLIACFLLNLQAVCNLAMSFGETDSDSTMVRHGLAWFAWRSVPHLSRSCCNAPVPLVSGGG